ncbi:unnamed protein product [Rhizoctonia solani]|nr:unnamed protein product [Rhizoctonia solani]
MRTDEVAVGWHEVAGSKINILWDSLEMLRDLLVLRANYVTGRWKVARVEKAKAEGGSVGNGHVTTALSKSDTNLRRRVADAPQK